MLICRPLMRIVVVSECMDHGKDAVLAYLMDDVRHRILVVKGSRKDQNVEIID